MPNDPFAELQSSGDLPADVQRFLEPRQPETWRHGLAVAVTAHDLAVRFGADGVAVRTAALCHDLAAVVPVTDLITVAEMWGVSLSAADRAIPQIIHGTLAAAVIRERLGVADPVILDAVRYHTTLRSQASLLDKIVFVADKLAYDPTTPRLDYLPALQAGLDDSLEAAASAYLDFIITHQAELGWWIHPLVIEAHGELNESLMSRR